jgi:hypothetical protein
VSIVLARGDSEFANVPLHGEQIHAVSIDAPRFIESESELSSSSQVATDRHEVESGCCVRAGGDVNPGRVEPAVGVRQVVPIRCAMQ